MDKINLFKGFSLFFNYLYSKIKQYCRFEGDCLKKISEYDFESIIETIFKSYDIKKEFPINPKFIAFKLGMKVQLQDLPDGISGYLIREGSVVRIIVRKQDPMNRQRFTISHEIGHFVHRMIEGKPNSNYKYIDLRSNFSSKIGKYEEVFANTFAANLLMPESELLRMLYEHRVTEEMAKFFMVSTEALSNRLNNINIEKIIKAKKERLDDQTRDTVASKILELIKEEFNIDVINHFAPALNYIDEKAVFL